jgi:hypothetical protein
VQGTAPGGSAGAEAEASAAAGAADGAGTDGDEDADDEDADDAGDGDGRVHDVAPRSPTRPTSPARRRTRSDDDVWSIGHDDSEGSP